jgi:aminoglycoside/choline kinase family phosphotransferase
LGLSETPIIARALDQNKLDYEFKNLFCEKYLFNYLGWIPSANDSHILNRFHIYLSNFITNLPLVALHRDFQSSNLIIHHVNSQLYLIDFQDMLMGPQAYDIVSLTKDNYVSLPLNLQKYLLERYWMEAKPRFSFEQFIQMADWCSIQRKLHDVGAFVFAYQRLSKEKFLEHIPKTISDALALMDKYPRYFKDVKRVLQSVAKVRPNFSKPT